MRSVATIALIALASGAAISAPVQRTPAQRAPVAAADQQSIKVGRAVVVRPFGAHLVDRLVLVGDYTVRGKRAYLIRGDAKGACPSRFVFATERADGAPLVSAPFGTCNGTVRVRSANGALHIAMPAAATGQPDAQFSFDGATVAPVTVAASAPADQCPPAAHVDPTLQAATIAAFEADYPAEFRTRRALNRMSIDPQELRSVVTTLACFAPWPAADGIVPQLATPLFSSRHGEAAFAALTSVAEDPTSAAHIRAAARSFAAEMIYRVELRRSS